MPATLPPERPGCSLSLERRVSLDEIIERGPRRALARLSASPRRRHRSYGARRLELRLRA
jgi:hypothetical protein